VTAAVRRGGGASLLWQVLLVVPPVIVLSAVALYSLRQDRAAIEQDARKNAAVLAPELARRWGARVQTDLAALVASACSSTAPAAQPANSDPRDSADTPVCGLILNGQIRVPLDYPALPTPPSWVSDRTAAPARLNAEWSRVRAEVQRGTAVNAATSLLDLAQRAVGVETDSGAPLSDLALLLALGHPPAGGFTDSQLQALEQHVVEHPSFLSGTLVEEATHLAPQSPTTARMAARWAANERALTLLRALRVEQAGGPSAVWLDAVAGVWLALVHPIATTGSATAAAPRTADHVTLVPVGALERIFQSAPESRDIPAYATATVAIGGRTFQAGRPNAPAAPVAWESPLSGTGRSSSSQRTRSVLPHHPPPVSRAPVVEDRRVLVRVGLAVVLAAPRLLDVVASEIEGAPARLDALVLHRPSRRADVALLRRAVRHVVALRVEQADAVRRRGHQRKAQLREVVLPAADGTDLVEARRVVEDEMAAARAGIVRHGKSPLQ